MGSDHIKLYFKFNRFNVPSEKIGTECLLSGGSRNNVITPKLSYHVITKHETISWYYHYKVPVGLTISEI